MEDALITLKMSLKITINIALDQSGNSILQCKFFSNAKKLNTHF